MKKLQRFLERTSFKNVSGNWQFKGDVTPERVFKVAEELYSPTDLLARYTEFLVKNGYCDSDVYSESPTAIERFEVLE